MVNVNTILKCTHGGERLRMKQSANAEGLSTWNQAPPSPLKRQLEPERQRTNNPHAALDMDDESILLRKEDRTNVRRAKEN
jgi:hypothetical protein